MEKIVAFFAALMVTSIGFSAPKCGEVFVNEKIRGTGTFPSLFVRPVAKGAYLINQDRMADPNLCGPSAIAQAIQNLFLESGPAESGPRFFFPGLPMTGPKVVPPSSRYLYDLADYLKTEFKFGSRTDMGKFKYTHIADMAIGLRKYLKEASGFKNAEVWILGSEAFDAPEGRPLSEFKRKITERDIAEAISSGYQVVTLIRKWRFDEALKAFRKVGGHYVYTNGYSYRENFSYGLNEGVTLDYLSLMGLNSTNWPRSLGPQKEKVEEFADDPFFLWFGHFHRMNDKLFKDQGISLPAPLPPFAEWGVVHRSARENGLEILTTIETLEGLLIFKTN